MRRFAFLLVALCFSCGGGDSLSDAGDEISSPLAAESPTFSPAGGTYTTGVHVEIHCKTPDAVVYYTTDGSLPFRDAAVYRGPIEITGDDSTLYIRAIAVCDGMADSPVVSDGYTIHRFAAE